ncbi:hypothetical protein [Streptomyces sp. NPDC046197]|uniref:hypothetical protein n=1 Tax=Streptomyces sp. NPDC046197 TaxID=3154337 RepID=UPI0033DDD662
MRDAVGRRKRVWRWAVAGWVLAVTVGGGLTLWLQDDTHPPEPHVWQNADPGTP